MDGHHLASAVTTTFESGSFKLPPASEGSERCNMMHFRLVAGNSMHFFHLVFVFLFLFCLDFCLDFTFKSGSFTVVFKSVFGNTCICISMSLNLNFKHDALNVW